MVLSGLMAILTSGSSGCWHSPLLRTPEIWWLFTQSIFTEQSVCPFTIFHRTSTCFTQLGAHFLAAISIAHRAYTTKSLSLLTQG